MKHVVFVAPFFLDTTLAFVSAVARHPGCRMSLISQDAPERLPARLRDRLIAHERVGRSLDPHHLAAAVERLAARVGPVDRLLGTLEQLQEPLAAVRDALGIEGMGERVANQFRDKARMKNVLREAGVPCARHRLLHTEADAWAFAGDVGYPLVIKPPDGAGAKATFQVDDDDGLRTALASAPPHPARPMLAEEFVQGDEHSFDGVSIDGRLVWHSLTHYRPNPLDVVRNPWIQWCVLLPREVDDPRYDDVRRIASHALDALGMKTGVSHLEWFRRRDGSIAVSEVGARPGGAQISRLVSYAHDVDFYRVWARLMIDETFETPRRAYAAGAAFLRGQGRGRVKAIHGLGRAQQELGPLVVESNLPKLGQPQQSGYEGEGYVILRHRETAVVERALGRLVSLVQVELG